MEMAQRSFIRQGSTRSPTRLNANLFLVGLGVALLAGCSPVYETQQPGGRYTVTTYSRLYGISGTLGTNTNVALRNCPSGFDIVGERFGTDAEGLYRRWTYECQGGWPAEGSDGRGVVGGDGAVAVGPQGRVNLSEPRMR
jgi:hypothetical protein